MSPDEAASTPPLAVGGLGGSGTRLIAQMLLRLGYYLGDDLNPASDNLWFTLLFKRTELLAESPAEFDRAVGVFRRAMVEGGPLTRAEEDWLRSLAETDRPKHDRVWLRKRVDSLSRAIAAPRRRPGPWGWKAPNTHIFLDRLRDGFPGLRYIHVTRNGLDMAYSSNQNQPRLWGRYLLGRDVAGEEITPRRSLEFWCRVHRRVEQFGLTMPGAYWLLDYDAFCSSPRDGLRYLGRFLGRTFDRETEADLLALVRPPRSIGRFRQHGLHEFRPEDVAYVQSLGFDTSL